MKTVRNNRYRRKRRRSDRERFLVLATILGGAVVIAAAIVICVLVFLPKKEEPALPPSSQAESQVSSETSSAPSKPAVDMSDVNPNAATAVAEGELAYQSLYPELYVPIVEKIPVKDGDKVIYLTYDDGPSEETERLLDILDQEYQSLYPELYVPIVEKIPVKDGDKVIYLTYDDGPSEETERLLDILDQEGVKATFFVMAQGKSLEDCKKWLKMIVDRGHAIGVHTYSHQYKEIYASPQAFLEDFKKMHDLIYEATGQKITMFRFAGGSVNAYNKATCKAIIAEMERRGYTYFDWNVDSGDSEKGDNGKFIYDTTTQEILSHQKSIVLMHNSKAKKATVDQTAAIIEKAKAAGYRFDVLDPSVKPFKFKIPE